MTTRLKGLLWIAGGVVALGAVMSAQQGTPKKPTVRNGVYGPETTRGESAPARQDLASRIGSDCRLTDSAPLARTAETIPEILESIKTHDRDNFAALAAGGKFVIVGEEPRARVIDSDRTSDAIKVRVLGGPKRGLEGWVPFMLCE